MTESKSRIREPYLTCPECNSRVKVRSSGKVIDKVREIRGTCTNDDCLKTSVFEISFVKFVQPRPPKSNRFKMVGLDGVQIPRAA